jgi:hypothetical protein
MLYAPPGEWVPNEKPVYAFLRPICLALPETTERLSHGEPTFFVARKSLRRFQTIITTTGITCKTSSSF